MLLLTSIASAITVSEVPDPRASGSWVSDVADVLDADAEARIDQRLSALERDTGAEVAVVTVNNVAGTPKEFAGDLFNTWGVGKADANNGLVVLLVLDARRIEMETGYGLEGVLSDGWLGAMQSHSMVPDFKLGNYGEGLENGIGMIDEHLRDNAEEVRLGALAPRSMQGRHGSGVSPVIGYGAAGGAAVLAGVGVWAFTRRRKRYCEDHEPKAEMTLLSEAEEDAHLEPGAQVEEDIGAAQWDVYKCPLCENIEVVRRDKWFAFKSDCPSCSWETCTSSSRVLRSATYSSSGTREVTVTCANCSYSHRYNQMIPRKVRVQTSSGSSGGYGGGSSGGGFGGGGGGGFGGGSSGGGGAGSSW